jgi:N-acetylneuraminate synthase
MEFDYYQLNELYNHSKSVGLDFICSPFSEYAVDVLEKAGVDVYKIGSGEFFNLKLIELILSTNKKLFISTGLSTWEEIIKISSYLKEKYPIQYKNIIFFHCTTSYPCPIEKIGIKNISRLKEFLKVENIGFSDHSGNPNTIIAGYFEGANYFEFHSIYSKDILGFDTSSSITFEDSKKLIEDVKYFDELYVRSNDKNIITNSLSELKLNFSKSLYYTCDLPKGTIIHESHLCLRKPGVGIPYEDINLFIGKSLIEDKSSGQLVNKEDIL